MTNMMDKYLSGYATLTRPTNLIRDDEDYRQHVDYVHMNPLKHGHVKRVQDWPYSTFHQYVATGIYPADWCGDVDVAVRGDE
jgi:putative transposase